MLNAQKIIEQVESMPLEARAQIVDALLRTLNQPDPAVDTEWARTATRRLQELRSGKVQGVRADTVFEKARERLSG